MFLDICDKIQMINNTYYAKFRPHMYQRAESEQVPLYIVFEGLIQIACRATSIAVFDGQPCIPARISKMDCLVTAREISYQDQELMLCANLYRKFYTSCVSCQLIHPRKGVLTEGEIWVALREHGKVREII